MSAASSFDPYATWLGIETHALGDAAGSGPDYYRLLGLGARESNPQTIRAAADKAKARVRSQRPGPHARQWAALLDEIDAAKTTLLSEEKRAAYDAALPSSDKAPQGLVDKPAAGLTVGSPNGSPDSTPSGAREPATSRGAHLGDTTAGFPATAPGSFSPPGKSVKAENQVGKLNEANKRAAATQPNLAAQLLGLGNEENVAFASTPAALPAAAATPLASESRPSAASADHEVDPFDPMAPVSFDEESPTILPEGTTSLAVAPPTASQIATQQTGSPELDPPSAVSSSAVSSSAVAMGAAAEIRAYKPSSPVALKAQTRKSGSPRWLFPAIAAGVLMLLAGVVLVLVLQGGFSDTVAGGNTSIEKATSGSAASQSPRPGGNRATRETSEIRRPAASDPAEEATPLLEGLPEDGSSEDETMPTDAGPTDSGPTDAGPTDTAAAENMLADTTPTESMPDVLDPAEANPNPSTTETPSESESPPPSPEEVVAFVNHLTGARTALTKQDVALATSELKAASPMASRVPYKQSYDQLAALVAAASEFWESFDRGAGSLVADQELTFGSTTVRVVEATKEQLSYEVAGSKQKRKLRELPLGLAIAVAEKGMSDPQGAEAKLQKGAPLAVQANEAQVARARAYWQEAQQQGAAAHILLAAIEDKYDFSSAAAPSSVMPADATAMAAAGAPSDTPTTPPPAIPPEVGKLLASAKKSLVEQDVERAVADLAQVDRLLSESRTGDSPTNDELYAKYDRLRLLTEYLTQFWSVVGESMAGLEVGEEIIVRDMPVAVIAADRDSVEVRTAGQSHRFTIANMPAGLALALAKMRLNEDDPATTMMAAALYAVHTDESFHATALKLWEEAAAAGADVGDLPQVLDDTYTP